MRRLMTLPGVCPVTQSDPSQRSARSSGSRTSRVSRRIWNSFRVKTPPGFAIKQKRLTRAGAPQVRWALGQAAWSLYLRRPEDQMVRWARPIAHAIASVRSTTCRARETLGDGRLGAIRPDGDSCATRRRSPDARVGEGLLRLRGLVSRWLAACPENYLR